MLGSVHVHFPGFLKPHPWDITHMWLPKSHHTFPRVDVISKTPMAKEVFALSHVYPFLPYLGWNSGQSSMNSDNLVWRLHVSLFLSLRDSLLSESRVFLSFSHSFSPSFNPRLISRSRVSQHDDRIWLDNGRRTAAIRLFCFPRWFGPFHKVLGWVRSEEARNNYGHVCWNGSSTCRVWVDPKTLGKGKPSILPLLRVVGWDLERTADGPNGGRVVSCVSRLIPIRWTPTPIPLFLPRRVPWLRTVGGWLNFRRRWMDNARSTTAVTSDEWMDGWNEGRNDRPRDPENSDNNTKYETGTSCKTNKKPGVCVFMSWPCVHGWMDGWMAVGPKERTRKWDKKRS